VAGVVVAPNPVEDGAPNPVLAGAPNPELAAVPNEEEAAVPKPKFTGAAALLGCPKLNAGVTPKPDIVDGVF
jgi:hypothetical protein